MKSNILLAINLLFLFSLLSNSLMSQKPPSNNFDWQGHRGARGLLPENTIPAFLKALEYPVTTLELDVAVSKDGQLIVSHEPWMSHHICNKPDGSPVTKSESKSLKIIELTYTEIKNFDCGSRGNERFPEQKAMALHKPSLAELVFEVKRYCATEKREIPNFNIEIKSEPNYDGVFTPPPHEFINLVVAEIEMLGIKEKCMIQSFDVRPLQELHKMDIGVPLILLVENLDGHEKNIEKLGFKPDGYSPYFKLLRKKHIKALHEQGVKVVPWTVNKVKTMKKLRRKGVDGIITDFPNLISEVE